MPNTSKNCSDSTNYKEKTTSAKDMNDCSQSVKTNPATRTTNPDLKEKTSQKANQGMNKTQ